MITSTGTLIGRRPSPASERRAGSIMVHAKVKVMTRKAATGWRATRRLSDEELAGR